MSVYCTSHDVDQTQHKQFHKHTPKQLACIKSECLSLHIPFHQVNSIVMKACGLQTSAARISCSAHALHWKHWRNDTPERSNKFLRACLAWVVGWNGLKPFKAEQTLQFLLFNQNLSQDQPFGTYEEFLADEMQMRGRNGKGSCIEKLFMQLKQIK